MIKDLAAERAVLAALVQFGLDFYMELDFLTTDCFVDTGNQFLFDCISNILSEGREVEVSSILSEASNLGNAIDKSEMAFVRSLMNFPISKANVPSHAAKLAKLSTIRTLDSTLGICKSELKKLNGSEDLADIISKVEEPILDVTGDAFSGNSNQTEILGEDVFAYIEYLTENVTETLGVPTGFSEYDNAIGGGLRRKCVDLIGARPKTGKSMIGDSIGVNIARQGVPVLMLDTEMSKEDHYNRILASLSNVKTNLIETGKFSETPSKLHAVKEAAKELHELPYHYLSIAGQSFDSILSQMRKWIYQHVGFDKDGKTNDCVIIYDYLKLMDGDSISSSMQEYQVLGFQITKLHNFMVKYDCPCLAFVQLNRDGVTKESSDVISGSDRLVWLCTSLSLFKMKSPEELAEDNQVDGDQGNTKLVPLHARHGGLMDQGDYVSLKVDGAYGRVIQKMTRNQIHSRIRENQEGFTSNEESDTETNF
jgi:replicative DNA helicase